MRVHGGARVDTPTKPKQTSRTCLGITALALAARNPSRVVHQVLLQDTHYSVQHPVNGCQLGAAWPSARTLLSPWGVRVDELAMLKKNAEILLCFVRRTKKKPT